MNISPNCRNFVPSIVANLIHTSNLATIFVMQVLTYPVYLEIPFFNQMVLDCLCFCIIRTLPVEMFCDLIPVLVLVKTGNRFRLFLVHTLLSIIFRLFIKFLGNFSKSFAKAFSVTVVKTGNKLLVWCFHCSSSSFLKSSKVSEEAIVRQIENVLYQDKSINQKVTNINP